MLKNVLKICMLFILIGSTGMLYGQKLKGVGLNGGYIIPIDNIQNGFSAEARLDFGEVLKYVFLFPTVAYWKVQENGEAQNLNREHFNFGVNFCGYINSKPRGFYGGAGIHYHIISAEEFDYTFDLDNPDIKSETKTKLGLSVLMGYLYPFKRFSVYLEPGYTFVHGGYSTLQMRLGVTYSLKKRSTY